MQPRRLLGGEQSTGDNTTLVVLCSVIGSRNTGIHVGTLADRSSTHHEHHSCWFARTRCWKNCILHSKTARMRENMQVAYLATGVSTLHEVNSGRSGLLRTQLLATNGGDWLFPNDSAPGPVASSRLRMRCESSARDPGRRTRWIPAVQSVQQPP